VPATFEGEGQEIGRGPGAKHDGGSGDPLKGDVQKYS